MPRHPLGTLRGAPPPSHPAGHTPAPPAARGCHGRSLTHGKPGGTRRVPAAPTRRRVPGGAEPHWAAPRGVVGEGAGRFLPPARPPAKMSDMEDDFMCDDEEDYDLVRAGRGERRARRRDLAGSAASGAAPRRQEGLRSPGRPRAAGPRVPLRLGEYGPLLGGRRG